MVNYVRAAVAAAGGTPSREFATSLQTKIIADSADILSDDKYLQPFLADDALLFSLDQVS